MDVLLTHAVTDTEAQRKPVVSLSQPSFEALKRVIAAIGERVRANKAAAEEAEARRRVAELLGWERP